MKFKLSEIQEHFDDFIADQSAEWLAENWQDIHHHAFNVDYFIIGTGRAIEWLGDRAFEVIEHIKEYETFNFGEVSTDFSNPESVVNMYAYILGEEVAGKWQEQFKEVI